MMMGSHQTQLLNQNLLFGHYQLLILWKNYQFFLYVGFQVYGNKDYIRAQVRSRDGIFYTNDHVIFGIDTYGDGRYYVGFGANPLGSILDYKEGSRGEAERSYNVEFEAKSQLTEYGYDVELKIPFSSLNYPDKEINKWKVLFERKLYNKGVESRYSSNKVIAGAGCNICQSQYFYLPGKVSQKSKLMLLMSKEKTQKVILKLAMELV